MIKTIKVKKQFRLDELIKYIFDNGIEDETYGVTVFNNPSEVRISGSGNIKLNGYINKHTTFTVEVEEEIAEDTVFETLVTVGIHGTVLQHKNISFSELSGRQLIDEGRQVFALINGKLQLIWEAE